MGLGRSSLATSCVPWSSLSLPGSSALPSLPISGPHGSHSPILTLPLKGAHCPMTMPSLSSRCYSQGLECAVPQPNLCRPTSPQIPGRGTPAGAQWTGRSSRDAACCPQACPSPSPHFHPQEHLSSTRLSSTWECTRAGLKMMPKVGTEGWWVGVWINGGQCRGC